MIDNNSGLPPYLSMLNDEQREAVFHNGTSLLILAGAGSGKTRVITTKIAYLIREQGVDPRAILAVTFTNKAAREMAERARLIDERAASALLRTFHSFGAWFLRRNGTLAGLAPGFVIYDDEDSVSLLGTLLEGSSKVETRQTAHHIARAKDYFLSPDDNELSLIDHRMEFRRIYRDYEERLAAIGNVDFGDLIKKPVEILRNNPAVAARFRARFQVIMVDEYQDANIAQFELLKELCGPETYVCVVGDDDQSIYGFRGAEVKNILEFPDRFADTDIIRLERNYRSFAPILRVASSVVDHNEDRLGKTLIAVREGGRKPVLAFLPNQDEEAIFCAELVSKSCKEGGNAKYSDWAVLYRTNAQSLGFETEFLRRGIPYHVVGSLKFYEREEIKDALALLSFLVNPRDEVAFRRVVNKPTRGVGLVTIERIVNEAAMLSRLAAASFQPDAALLAEAAFTEEEAAFTWEEALAEEAAPAVEKALTEARVAVNLQAAAKQLAPQLAAKARSGLDAFFRAIESGRATLSPLEEEEGERVVVKRVPRKRQTKQEKLRAGEGLSVCVVALVNEAGIAEYHLSHDDIAGNQRINNLQELANAASLYPATEAGLLDFLEHIELDRSIQNTDEQEKNSVTFITLHNTKGLEFRHVIMTGVEQGVFPREDKQKGELEEERRLFYVGATRAMDELYLCSCAMRRMYGRTMDMIPSLFLHEVDRQSLRIIGTVPSSFSQKPKPRYADFDD
jgi:DNA helicase-2/ATP-dependent DNA helicase PcrA